MANGYQDIAHIAGLVFIQRGFVDKAKDTEAIRAACPYGDLRDDELETFEACIHHPRLRKLIDEWWASYDEARAAGQIPAAQPWLF